MTISKAQWATDGDNIRFSMPLTKVDKERRIVSGFATLDNIDKQADIVTSEASMQAFSKFRGNIREMHEPLAVGKMVSFREDKYFDPDTKKMYNGVFVSAYVSKGAQDTWEKVLDGTLSGFSIGGRMNKWDDAYDSKMDRQIRVIKDYDLVELSLVDNPANQFANVMSIEKVDGVDVVKGDIADLDIENVFWDSESGLVMLSKNESEKSPISNLIMKNIGFVETNDNEKSEMIKFLVDSAKGIKTEIDKEVNPMTEENAIAAEEVAVEKSQEVAPEADTAIVADTVKSENYMDEDKSMQEKMEDEEEEMKAEKSEDMEDDESEDDKGYKKSDVVEEVSKSDDAITTAVSEIQSGIASAFSDLSEVVKSLSDEIAELKKSIGMAEAKLNDAENGFNNLGKRVDAVEADTAFRKSGDLGEIVQETQINKSEQSLWGGRFLKTADLFN